MSSPHNADDLPQTPAELDGGGASLENFAGASSEAPVAQKKTPRIATVSHTLDAAVADRLRHFAFRERISESAVIEFALRELFARGDDASLGDRLRQSGAALRRKT